MVVVGVRMSSSINIFATIDVTLYNSLKELYRNLLQAKKDVYDSNERILIRHTPNSLNLINELLVFIDIPDYFVIFEELNSSSTLDFSLSDSHCIYPWANLLIDNVGEFRPCCRFNGNISIDNKIATINSSSLQSVYFSDYMKTLRNKLLLGEKPTECAACWRDEAAGILSMRQGAKYKFKDIYYELNYLQEDFENLQIFDLKLGNACNLSCRICNQVASSKIAEQNYSNGILSTIEFNLLKETVRWADTEQFWDQMLETVQNLKYLDLYGGEPLMSKLHFTFLKKLIELNVAKNIKIDYNTNGTIFSERFFDLWNKFKEVKLSFSIDDIADRFESQRCGASWKQVCKNIKEYNSRRSDKFITEVFVTINTQNVFWLPELIEWFETEDFDFINFNILDYPLEFNIHSLSAVEQKNVITKLEAYVKYPIIKSIIKLFS